MPKFLEVKLKKEYPDNPGAVYGTMNKMGAMKGNKETAKGAAMQAKHEAKSEAKATRITSKAGGGTESYNWRNRHGQAKVRRSMS